MSGSTSDRSLSFLAGGGEMGERMRAMDWAQKPLGPPEQWPPALKMIVGVLLASRFPHLLWWGPDYLSIYNDAYRSVLGTKHPWALGRPFREVWTEVAHVLAPLIDTPFHGGPASWTDDIQLEINRHGFFEESHFQFAYSPVPDDTAPNGIGGVLATVNEITEKVIGERRLAILRDVGSDSGAARPVEEVCAEIAQALASYPLDIPFALIYLCESEGNRARLAGATGVAGGAPAAPISIDLATPSNCWRFDEVARTQAPVIVEALSERFEEVPPGPWSDPPQKAFVAPIQSSPPGQLAGFLVVGVSARLALDERYLAFLDLLVARVSAAIATARAYQAERHRAEALAKIDRAKTVFFSNVSHEFRTPLTLLLAPLEDLLGGVVPDEAVARRAMIEVAHRNALRLTKLVNTLLDFSRIEAGRADAVYEPTDLAQLSAELASNFRSLVERAGLDLEIDAAQPVIAVVDRELWEKVVLNLVSNAFKFTFEGRISVRVRREGEYVVLGVSDTGTGIAAHELPNLFKRFHRISGARGRSFEGSGIGLALVHEIVRLHGGTIEVDSSEGRGSTFRVTIPSGSSHLPPERIRAERARLSTAIRPRAYVEEATRWLSAPAPDALEVDSPPDYLETDVPRRRVLVVDDNTDMREYIARRIAMHHEVVVASDGEEALRAVAARPPDLVVTDVMMPRLDGFGFLRALRADPSLQGIPVILLSARAGDAARVEGIDAGADDYLTKPFSADELLARANNALRLVDLRRREASALRESEARFRALVNASSNVVYRMSADWTEMRHLDGRGFLADLERPSIAWLTEYILPEDHAEVTRAIENAVREKSVFEFEHRVRRIDGSVGWAQSRAIPIVEDGRIVEWFGMATDVTARKQSEQHRKLLLDELNHRVKNTLAIVQSIVRQSLREVEGSELARDQLDQRLIALAKAHDTLTREHWEDAPIARVVADALRPHRLEGRADFSIQGPPVSLSPRQVIGLSMALQELVTNAIKYGALSVAGGTVDLSWQLVPESAPPLLRIRWIERGGPPVRAPRRRGFGMRLLSRGLSQDLGGGVELDFAPGGLRCTMEATLEMRQRRAPSAHAGGEGSRA